MKKALIFLILLVVYATISARVKFDERVIRAELRKPGVKLVAVDFYMTGCQPCDKAIKKWKELKQQYGDTLKLIVVAPQRPDGSCNVKGWNPDRMICDYGQEIAGNWGVHDFPQAFLYSWHNDYPLLEHSQVKDVEEKIREYLRNIPRVAIDADKNTKNLVSLIEEELIRNSKIELVANESERKRLVELREESYNGQYDDDLRCELGKEISPNSVMKVTKQGADLVLRLSSVAKGCTMAAATKTLSRNQSNLKTEIAAAVYDLLSQMFGHISKPDDGGKTAKLQKQPEQSSNPADSKACEYARKEDTLEIWERYLKRFPNGECSFEAESQIATKNKEIQQRVKELYLQYQENQQQAKEKTDKKEVKHENEMHQKQFGLLEKKISMIKEYNQNKPVKQMVEILKLEGGNGENVQAVKKAAIMKIYSEIIGKTTLHRLPEFKESPNRNVKISGNVAMIHIKSDYSGSAMFFLMKGKELVIWDELEFNTEKKYDFDSGNYSFIMIVDRPDNNNIYVFKYDGSFQSGKLYVGEFRILGKYSTTASCPPDYIRDDESTCITPSFKIFDNCGPGTHLVEHLCCENGFNFILDGKCSRYSDTVENVICPAGYHEAGKGRCCPTGMLFIDNKCQVPK